MIFVLRSELKGPPSVVALTTAGRAGALPDPAGAPAPSPRPVGDHLRISFSSGTELSMSLREKGGPGPEFGHLAGARDKADIVWR